MKKITFLLLLAVFGIMNVNAQWQTDTAVNTLVADSTTSDTQSISTSTGGTYVVYWKSVPAPVNFEIWVQYLDADGMKMFGDNGMLVTNTLPMSTYSVVWKLIVDGKNNLYISVTGTGTGTPANVYKITPIGEMPWGTGLNVGSGYMTTVLPLSNYDVLISWMPTEGGKAKIQRYDELGVAIWTSPIEISPSSAYATNATVVANMYEQSNGYFTAVFHTRLGFGVNSYLFAQRYDSAGVPQWTQPTQLADKGSSYNNLSYGGTQDGDVIYYGYSLATVSRFDAFAQRLNTDGTLPWGINGADFDINVTNYETNAKIAFEPGSQYVWMISNYTPSSQSTHGEYVQKFDKVTGARQFTDYAHEVYPVDSNSRVHTGNLYLVNDKPLFALKSGMDTGALPITLNAQFLDNNGNFTAPYVIPLATFSAPKGRITLNKPVNNQGVITFTEQKVSGQTKAYAHNFSTILDLECTITANAIADYNAACSIALADLTAPVADDSCGNAVTATTNSSIFPITGTTTITWTFTTVSGATATQTQNLIVNNTITPTILADVISQCSVGIADLTVPVITDSCGNAVTATTDESIFPLTQGTTTITWTFTTASATTATQTQNVIVNDTTAPVLIVQNISTTVAEDGSVIFTVGQFDNGSTDSCGGDTATWTWSVSPASFTCADLGEQTVTITATDANGNVATTTATVTITDPNNYCDTAGTSEFNKKTITVYPNPTQDIFNINSSDAIKSIVVYDMLGKMVFRTAISATNVTIDTKSWSTGVYSVTIENVNGGQQRVKLVKN